jgi:DNA repair protein RadC
VINSPADAAALVQHEMSLLEQEYLKVIVLNTRNHVLDIVEVTHGSVNSSQVRVAEVLRPAVERNSPAIIVVHNHPSSDPTPSPDDIKITQAIREAGKLMDIELLDHLIIAKGSYVSLKEKHLGF